MSMSMNERLVPFEVRCEIHYYSDDERREKKLPSEHLCIGEGVCPLCGKTITVVSDAGIKGRDEYRGHNYFVNHFIKRSSEKEALVLCHGSEEIFYLLVDQVVVGTVKATA